MPNPDSKSEHQVTTLEPNPQAHYKRRWPQATFKFIRLAQILKASIRRRPSSPPTPRLIIKKGGRRPPSNLQDMSRLQKQPSDDNTRAHFPGSLQKKVAEGQLQISNLQVMPTFQKQASRDNALAHPPGSS